MADFKSSDLLNAIRTEASQAYKDRVPTATQATLSQVGTAIFNHDETRNEFASALLNRIGLTVVKNRLFTNPLSEFKKGMLEYGKDIEEIYVDIIKGQSFDPSLAESELYKRVIPTIATVFHRLNRQDMYKTTVQRNTLKQAFLSENSLMSLVDNIIQSLYTSDNFDEFLLMKNLIHTYGVEGKFHMVAVAPVTDEATGKLALAKIKEISNNITFLSKDYNFAGVSTHTVKEDQIVLINTKFDALIDVEVLASAFNMSKVEFIGRRVLVDDFGGLENVLCAVVDKDWFMVYDNEIISEQAYNQQGLYYNYFLHHWQTLSVSPFANAILFVTVAPTLTAIDLYPATADTIKGGAIQLVTEATGTGNPSSKCVFTHNGTDTNISSTGLMVIGKNETMHTITVTATSVVDDEIDDTATITVTDIPSGG